MVACRRTAALFWLSPSCARYADSRKIRPSTPQEGKNWDDWGVHGLGVSQALIPGLCWENQIKQFDVVCMVG